MNKDYNNHKNNSSQPKVSPLSELLIQILSSKEWSTDEEIYLSVTKQYKPLITKDSVLRELRRIRKGSYFVLLGTFDKNTTKYKICRKEDVSKLNKFIDINEEDILRQHKKKNSWRNLI